MTKKALYGNTLFVKLEKFLQFLKFLESRVTLDRRIIAITFLAACIIGSYQPMFVMVGFMCVLCGQLIYIDMKLIHGPQLDKQVSDIFTMLFTFLFAAIFVCYISPVIFHLVS